MADERVILGELDAENLRNRGLLGPGSSTGSRRIHKRRLNRSSEEEYGDISLDVHLNSPGAEEAFATIPVALISHDTLHYLGFSTNKANEIWIKWTNWPVTGPQREIDPDDGGLQVTFIDFVTAHLEAATADVYEDNDVQWRQCLEMCGICESVQEAIMDPNFSHIRLNNSCIFWVKDTLTMRYAGLEDIGCASRQREMELVRAASRPSGSGSGGRGGGRGDGRRPNASRGGSTSSRTLPQGQRSVSGLQQQMAPGISSILWTSGTAMEAAKRTGQIALFKGMDQGRIVGLFNDSGEVHSIEKLLTLPPSDFSGTRSLFYFTPDYKVAEYYAAYAKRRANCESVVIVCLYVSKNAIDNLEDPDIQRLYWPTPQWKQFVWRSKTAKPLPKTLLKYRDALLIIGNIPKGTGCKFENMHTWEDVTDDSLHCVGPSNRCYPSIQYVFSGEEEGREFLDQHGEIDVFLFSEAELQALLARNM